MTVSKLSKGSILTPNHYNGRAYKITRVTIHEMAAVWTAERCGEWFRDGTRNASSNYGIGNDGKVMCYVEEQNAAWTSANYDNDNRAITIEVSNSIMGGDWPISAAAYNSLVALCADICKRYGIVPNYNGTPNASFTEHKMFSATACPGPYIHERLANGKLIRDITAAMTADDPKPASPAKEIQVHSSNGTAAQKFEIAWDAKREWCTLKNKANGLYLDVAGGKDAKGTKVQLYKGNGSDAQKFRFVAAGAGYNPPQGAPVYIVPKCAQNMVLDMAGGKDANGTAVHLYPKNGTPAQQWAVLDHGGKLLTFLNMKGSHRALDAKNGGK